MALLEAHKPTGSRAALLCCVLLALLVDYADRNVVSLLLVPIGKELGLSYLQLASLGAMLLIFYMIASLPISIAVERAGDRSKLLGGAVAVWTVFAALSGAAQSYRSLLLCRIMVGIGEATVAPCAQTLISDLFPPSERAGALAIYLSGIPLGTAVGYGLGGIVAHLSVSWRWTLLAVAGPGVPVAAMAWLCIADPRRGAAPVIVQGSTSAIGHLGTGLQVLWSISGFGWLATGSLSHAIAFSGVGFTAAFLQLKHGMTVAESASYNVFAAGLIPWACVIVGGQLINMLVRRTGSIKWMLWLPQLCAPPALACNLVGYLTEERGVSQAALAMASAIWSLSSSGVSSLLQTTCPRGARAIAITVLLFFSFGGASIGSLIIGVLTDHLEPSLGAGRALSQALVMVSVPFSLLGIVLSLRAACIINFRSAVVLADQDGHSHNLL